MKNRKLMTIIIVGVVVGILVFMWKEGIWAAIFKELWSFYEGLLFVLAAIVSAYTTLYYIDKIPVKRVDCFKIRTYYL